MKTLLLVLTSAGLLSSAASLVADPGDNCLCGCDPALECVNGVPVSSSTTTTTTTVTTTTAAPTTTTTTTFATYSSAASSDRAGVFRFFEKFAPSTPTGFFISNIPRHREDLPSLRQADNTLYLYRNEPSILGLWSEEKFIRITPSDPAFKSDVVYEHHIGSVDEGNSTASFSPGVAREAFVELRPRGNVGDKHSYNVTISKLDGSENVSIPFEVVLVESHSARLSSLSVSPGRLEPEFDGSRSNYRLRIPPPSGWTNEEDARKALENQSYGSGSSYVTINFATLNDRDAECSIDGGEKWFKAEGKFKLNVMEKDFLEAMVDKTPIVLKCRSADGTNVLEYPLTLVPQYGGETLLSDIKVLGADVSEVFDPNNHGPYHVDLSKGAQKDGDKSSLPWTRVAVKKHNPHAVVKVNGHELKFDESAMYEKDMLVSDWIKIPRGERSKVDIVVSTPENPVAEVYSMAISRESTNHWWSSASSVKALNWLGWISTLLSGRNAAHILNNNKVLDMLSTYGHTAGNNEIYNEFATGFHVWNAEPGHPCTVAGEPSSWIKLLSPEGETLNCSVLADGAPLEELTTFRLFNENGKMVDDEMSAEKTDDGKWKFTSVKSASARKLISVSADEREQFRHMLDAKYQTQQNLYYNISTLTLVGSAVVGLLVAYGFVYVLFLRDPESGQLRHDYPVILHPTRFLTFVIDFVFIGFVLGAFGVLFTPKQVVSGVLIFGRIHMSKALLNAVSIIVIMLAVGYIAAGSAALASVADKIGYSAQFCDYHDLVMTHGRAVYVPKWARNIPVLRRICAINIDALVPLKSANVPGSQAVGFTEVQSSTANSADPEATNSQYYQKLYIAGDKYVCEEGPEMRDSKSIQVAINDYLYNDQATNYDGRNHQIYGQYPEAKFGETKFSLTNPYGYKVNVESDLQIQHLTSLMQLIDDFKFWIPRNCCYFPNTDGLKNLLSVSGSTGGSSSGTPGTSSGLYYDWTINRSLLFLTLGIYSFFNERYHSTTLALYVLALFSFASAMIRLPSVIYSADAKSQRDMRLRARYMQQVSTAIHKSRTADKIWPFTEPGFMDRFRGLQKRKQNARFFGLASLYANLKDGGATDAIAAPQNSGEESFLVTMMNSTAAYRLREILLSACGADIALFVLGVVLILGRSDSSLFSSPTIPGISSFVLCCSMLFWINFRSLVVLYSLFQDTLDSILQETTEFAVHCADAFTATGGIGDQIKYYMVQVKKVMTGDKTANFHYPKASNTVRKFPVSQISIVSNELGLQFPGRIAEPDLYDAASVPNSKRLRLYKTLVMHGGIAGKRDELYRSMPVQVPFSKLLHDEGAPAMNPDANFGRLIATIQVVNHTLRANMAGLPATTESEHDSFLSLYAHPEFLPEPGKITLRKDGHTFSVRYNYSERRLVVRGPSIMANKMYTLRTSHTEHRKKDMYINGRNPDESISSGSAHEKPMGRAASAHGVCESPGALRVSVPPVNEPWLHRTILIKPPQEPPFEINPEEIKVYYDRDCGELLIRHEDLLAGRDYTVEWFVIPSSPESIDLKGRAQENGCVIFDLPQSSEGLIDLKSWMVLKDDSGAVIDIDPSMTDAYQFFFPETSQGVLKGLINHITSLASMVRGGDKESETMEEPIPCTVTQCVNPLQKIYRLDPNFSEGSRILMARMHEFRARQKACETSSLVSLWPTLMRPNEYVQFWRQRGVTATDEFGNLVDPLNETVHVEVFHSRLSEIAQGEQELRRILSNLLDEKIEKLANQLEAVRIWERAYEDPVLHTSQLQADLGEWSNQSSSSVLEQQKALYSARVSGFFYPCNVPDALITKRPNLSAQFRVWSNIIQTWLFAEEGVDVSNPETRLRISSVVRDVMQSLKYVLHSNELVSKNQYKSVLHYVIGSHTLRGVDSVWKPDGMKAHTALVRIWTEDENKENSADFSKYPEWLPCLLRLTPQSLQILLPNGDDLVRPGNGDFAFPWQKSTGLYIPLHAFHKFELLENDVLTPAHEESNVLLNFMTTRLICRKNQRDNVPDCYAQRVEDDHLGNEICFTDTTGQRRMKYRMMLGHTVPAYEADNYPQNEVDPTLNSPDVNVFPLSFRMSPAFAAQWRRAIQMARLDEPHPFSFRMPEPDMKSNTSSSSEVETNVDPPSVDGTPNSPPRHSDTSSSSSSSSSCEPVPIPPPVDVSSSDGMSTSIESNPEGVSLYEGGVVDSHFSGNAIMRDEGGRAVYEGMFVNGMRQGKGKLCFTDANRTQWHYEGNLDANETSGECFVSLADSTAVANVTDRHTLIHYAGHVSPPVPNHQSRMTAGEISALLSSNKKMREQAFVEPPSNLPNKEKVIQLVRSVYVREEPYGHRFTADRFMVSDVAMDSALVEAAREEDCALSRFLRTLLPHKCLWQDSSTLQRAAADGEWRFVDGSVFKGTLENGKPHGKGLYNHWPTNTVYEGPMHHGVPDGEGVLLTGDSAHRSRYLGQLKAGARHGSGTLITHDNRATVKAHWANDKMDTGRLTVQIEQSLMKELNVAFSHYEGSVKNGIIDGEATITGDSDFKFRGMLSEGMRQGPGELRNAQDEVILEGHFVNDMPEGHVKVARYPDGYVYKGEMVKGLRQGMGQLVDPKTESVIYEGTWANDVPHGRGIYRGVDGEYEGEFRNGKRQGKGRFVFNEKPLANGKQRVYEGDWSNDMPHGIGKYTNDDGLECVYRLEKGEIVNSSVSSYAPACGKAPAVSTKPTIKSSNFRPVPEADLPWKKAKNSNIKSVVEMLIGAAPTWEETVGRSTTFIDPTRIVPLERA